MIIQLLELRGAATFLGVDSMQLDYITRFYRPLLYMNFAGS